MNMLFAGCEICMILMELKFEVVKKYIEAPNVDIWNVMA